MSFQKQSPGSSEDQKREVLDQAYEDTMERINMQKLGFRQIAERVLSWITCAKRTLTTKELQHALAIDAGDSKLDEDNLERIERMVSVCAGLVTVDEESGIVRLVHYTTQEYFDRKWMAWFPNAETNIATTCVVYLSFDDFKTGICQNDDELEQRLQLHRLYDYASHNWGHHARASAILISEVSYFLDRKAQVKASIQALLAVKRYSSETKYSQIFPKKMTGLHLVAYFGVKANVQQLLEHGADVNAADEDGQTPLYRASHEGHVEVVRLCS